MGDGQRQTVDGGWSLAEDECPHSIFNLSKKAADVNLAAFQ